MATIRLPAPSLRTGGAVTHTALTDVLIRNTKPTDRPVKLADGDGLYLFINPNGSRWWRFRYRIGEREKMISFGTYPEVPLKIARERREDARRLVAGGGDPSAKRQAERAARADTFEAIAREWLAPRPPPA